MSRSQKTHNHYYFYKTQKQANHNNIVFKGIHKCSKLLLKTMITTEFKIIITSGDVAGG